MAVIRSVAVTGSLHHCGASALPRHTLLTGLETGGRYSGLRYWLAEVSMLSLVHIRLVVNGGENGDGARWMDT